VRVVLCTCPPEPADALATTLVEERLVACVNLIPGIRSIYRWEGEVTRDDEVLLIIKTRADLVERLRQRIVELHPYEIPEVVSIDVDAVHPPYLAWLREATRS
jgi:periplasmic divalent cation tolerance protein